MSLPELNPEQVRQVLRRFFEVSQAAGLDGVMRIDRNCYEFAQIDKLDEATLLAMGGGSLYEALYSRDEAADIHGNRAEVGSAWIFADCAWGEDRSLNSVAQWVRRLLDFEGLIACGE